ncbi:AraC family transcriptional regulator [Lachnospiraceae bacterium OttesenSCG-928-D06]|nr:AraC family transcriptional regulator [Lachnospiraceae bacterium OttesenSCG-928-D06]
MAHTQYPITEVYRQNPVERLLYISLAQYGTDWVSIFHSHSFSELFYVLEGEGFFCSEQERIPLKSDSLIIINPNIRHTEISSKENPLRYIVLGIDNLQFQFKKEEISTHYNVFDMYLHKNILLSLLQPMLTEVRQENESYEQICQHYLTILLLKITRITGDKLACFTPLDIPSECKYIKEFIDSNYHSEISLSSLALLTHQNKFYLSHMFTEAYGIAPITYLLERRILHSKNLLRNSDYSITSIAQMTGFSSSNYFTQSFKKNTGLTPRQYRVKYKI